MKTKMKSMMVLVTILSGPFAWGRSADAFFPGKNQDLVEDYSLSIKGELTAGSRGRVRLFQDDEFRSAPYIKKTYTSEHPDKKATIQVWTDRKSGALVKVVENWEKETTIANYDGKSQIVDLAFCHLGAKDCLVLDADICDRFLQASGKSSWFDFAQDLKNCSQMSQRLNQAVRKDSGALSERMKKLFQSRVIDEQTAAYGEQDPQVSLARLRNSQKPSGLLSWGIFQAGGNPQAYRQSFNIGNYQVEDQLARGCYQIQKSFTADSRQGAPPRLSVEPSRGSP